MQKWKNCVIRLVSLSVQPLCSLCLCGYRNARFNNHRDTENTEVGTEKKLKLRHYRWLTTNHTDLLTISLAHSPDVKPCSEDHREQDEHRDHHYKCVP